MVSFCEHNDKPLGSIIEFSDHLLTVAYKSCTAEFNQIKLNKYK
jgi:hypothetical protein